MGKASHRRRGGSSRLGPRQPRPEPLRGWSAAARKLYEVVDLKKLRWPRSGSADLLCGRHNPLFHEPPHVLLGLPDVVDVPAVFRRARAVHNQPVRRVGRRELARSLLLGGARWYSVQLGALSCNGGWTGRLCRLRRLPAQIRGVIVAQRGSVGLVAIGRFVELRSVLDLLLVEGDEDRLVISVDALNHAGW